MSIKKVSVVTPNGEHTIMTSRPKAVRAVITVRQQVMKHVTIVRQDAREQSVIKISHQISHSRATTCIEAKSNNTSYERFKTLFVRYCREAPPRRRGKHTIFFAKHSFWILDRPPPTPRNPPLTVIKMVHMINTSLHINLHANKSYIIDVASPSPAETLLTSP